jgi:hypothetical protein
MDRQEFPDENADLVPTAWFDFAAECARVNAIWEARLAAQRERELCAAIKAIDFQAMRRDRETLAGLQEWMDESGAEYKE